MYNVFEKSRQLLVIKISNIKKLKLCLHKNN